MRPEERALGNPAFTKFFNQAVELARQGRFDEARSGFEQPELTGELPGLSPKELFSYLFQYATTLGALGQLVEMDEFMTRALTVAAEQLGDLERCKQAWYWLLHWARQHAEWSFLERQCSAARDFGSTTKSASIQLMAAEFCAHAHRGLGLTAKARQGGEAILKCLKDAGADAERLSEWEQFLREIGPS